MKLDENILNRCAEMAKISIGEDEKAEMLQELNKVLDWMEQIKEVDTGDLEPMISPSQAMNITFEDGEGQPMPQDEALKNAPRKKNGYFVVPLVVKKTNNEE